MSDPLTWLDGEVTALDHSGPVPVATVRVVMTNGAVMAQGSTSIELPTP